MAQLSFLTYLRGIYKLNLGNGMQCNGMEWNGM